MLMLECQSGSRRHAGIGPNIGHAAGLGGGSGKGLAQVCVVGHEMGTRRRSAMVGLDHLRPNGSNTGQR